MVAATYLSSGLLVRGHMLYQGHILPVRCTDHTQLGNNSVSGKYVLSYSLEHSEEIVWKY